MSEGEEVRRQVKGIHTGNDSEKMVKSTYRTRDTGWKEVTQSFQSILHFLLDV